MKTKSVLIHKPPHVSRKRWGDFVTAFTLGEILRSFDFGVLTLTSVATVQFPITRENIDTAALLIHTCLTPDAPEACLRDILSEFDQIVEKTQEYVQTLSDTDQ